VSFFLVSNGMPEIDIAERLRLASDSKPDA